MNIKLLDGRRTKLTAGLLDVTTNNIMFSRVLSSAYNGNHLYLGVQRYEAQIEGCHQRPSSRGRGVSGHGADCWQLRQKELVDGSIMIIIIVEADHVNRRQTRDLFLATTPLCHHTTF